MGYPTVREVAVRVAFDAEECRLVEAAALGWGDCDAEPPTFDELVGIWVQLGVDERIARERERRYRAG